jgi:hypothetical protein
MLHMSEICPEMILWIPDFNKGVMIYFYSMCRRSVTNLDLEQYHQHALNPSNLDKGMDEYHKTRKLLSL